MIDFENMRLQLAEDIYGANAENDCQIISTELLTYPVTEIGIRAMQTIAENRAAVAHAEALVKEIRTSREARAERLASVDRRLRAAGYLS